MTAPGELNRDDYPYASDDEFERMNKRSLEDHNEPDTLREKIREALGLEAKIERVVRTTSTPPHYRIVTDGGTVHLGPSSRWAVRGTEFSAAFLDSLHVMPTLPRGEARASLFSKIVRVAEEEDIGAEATTGGQMRSWLTQYLSQRPPVATLDEAAPSEYPYRDGDGRTVMFGGSFTRWLWLQHQEKLSGVEFGRRMREVNAEPDKVNVSIDKVRTSRSVWVLAAEPEAEDEHKSADPEQPEPVASTGTTARDRLRERAS